MLGVLRGAERPHIIVSPISPPTKLCFCQTYVNSWSFCFLQTAVEKVFWVKLKTSIFYKYFLKIPVSIFLKILIVKRSYLFQLSWHHFFFGKDWNEAWRFFFRLPSLGGIPWENQQASCTELPLYYYMAVFCLLVQSRPCCLLTIGLKFHKAHGLFIHTALHVSASCTTRWWLFSLPSKINSLVYCRKQSYSGKMERREGLNRSISNFCHLQQEDEGKLYLK